MRISALRKSCNDQVQLKKLGTLKVAAEGFSSEFIGRRDDSTLRRNSVSFWIEDAAILEVVEGKKKNSMQVKKREVQMLIALPTRGGNLFEYFGVAIGTSPLPGHTPFVLQWNALSVALNVMQKVISNQHIVRYFVHHWKDCCCQYYATLLRRLPIQTSYFYGIDHFEPKLRETDAIIRILHMSSTTLASSCSLLSTVW